MKKTPFGFSAASAMNTSSSSFSAFKFPNPFGSLGRRHKSSKDLSALSADESTDKTTKKKKKTEGDEPPRGADTEVLEHQLENGRFSAISSKMSICWMV
ncbi:hypothetical protein QR680_018674 [Steinernema hermaphroditum]|uniref:Uncharacterized protein n=1 Tax=Steinernema hermaphroditum TaxID=289476 RepID=A0AA39LR40_9BILA|nr:hypothetical protein QR680_018674 [Steinernema hermaphroditum]